MAEQLPATAKLADTRDGLAVYINPEPGEKSSVWVVNQETGDAEKVCVTNPESPVLWQQMNGPESDAVEVSLDNIAAAETAWIFPGDTPRIIVEGCPDYRNVWSYIIDLNAKRAWQLPSSEGVARADGPNPEIVGAFYGYDENGRYSYFKAFSPQGKYLYSFGDKEYE